MRLFSVFYLIIFFALLVGCNTECDTPQIIKANSSFGYLPPYTGVDTLTFLHNNLDTQVYIGQGISQYWIPEAGTDMECPKKYEGLSYNFVCNSNGNNISFTYAPLDDGISSGRAGYTFFFNKKVSGYLTIPSSSQIIAEVIINGTKFTDLRYFTSPSDTSTYILASLSWTATDVVVKIQYPGDTLTLLK